MTFCVNCGAQLAPSAYVCSTCGHPTANARAQEPPPAPPSGIPFQPSVPAAGFLAALFDFSFNTFVTTKLIKVLYVLGVLAAAVTALGFAVSGFLHGVGLGLLMLVVVAPLVFLAGVIYWRVLMELIIVLFRAAEHLAEIARQGRR